LGCWRRYIQGQLAGARAVCFHELYLLSLSVTINTDVVYTMSSSPHREY